MRMRFSKVVGTTKGLYPHSSFLRNQATCLGEHMESMLWMDLLKQRILGEEKVQS